MSATQSAVVCAEQCVPMGFDVRPKAKRHEAVPVMVWSDFHLDEVVDPSAMNGLNEFNPTIAQERMNRLMACTTSVLRIYQQNSDINTAIVAILGDLITGWIHDDNVSSNELTPPEGIVAAISFLTGALQTLLTEFPDMQFIVVEAPGNHGRITLKVPHKKSARKNLEHIVYSVLARHFANEPRVKFRPPAGDMNWLTVMGRPTRWLHGTGIKYLGGIGGPTVGILKAIRAWDTGQKAALTVAGHLHTPLSDLRSYVWNGALKGYDEFARDVVKAEFSLASQVMFLLHQKYWLTGIYSIKVQDVGNSPDFQVSG